MNEREVRSNNIIKALCPPFIYFFINLTVQVVVGIVIFANQFEFLAKKKSANYADSYSFMNIIDDNMIKYSYIITLISAVIAVMIFGIWYYKVSQEYEENGLKNQFSGNRLDKPWLITMLGIFAGVGLSRFVSLLPLDNIIGNYEDTSNALMGGNLFVQILSLVIIVPVAEELIYRGLVFTGLTKVMDAKYALIFSSLMFGLFHFNLLQGTYAFLLSLILICIYMKYKTILAPIIIHSSANLAAVISSYYGLSEFFNKSLILYIIIMTVELFIALLLFVLIFGEEK